VLESRPSPMMTECLRRTQSDTQRDVYDDRPSDPSIVGFKMPGEFILEKVEWFDDVVVDEGQRRVHGTPFTPRMMGDVFEKWVVLQVRGDVGTYMNAIKLEPPKSYGKPQNLPAGITTIALRETTAIIVKVVLKMPVPGTYRLILYLGDTKIGITEIQL
jgi:hypothetical protein